MKHLYLTALFVFISLLNSKAEIFYTDIEPDSVLRGSSTNIWAMYVIDLDFDELPDFALAHFYPSDDLHYTEFSCSSQNHRCEMLVDENQKPLILNYDDLIDSQQNTWFDSQNFALLMRESWVGTTDKYIGVRITKNSMLYYGWIRVDIASDELSCTIKDFAYETTPNKAIKAGEQNSVDNREVQIADNQFNIYPNPAKNYIKIENYNPDYALEIINTLGITVLKKLQITDDILELSGIPAGIYFIRNGTKIQKLLILST